MSISKLTIEMNLLGCCLHALAHSNTWKRRLHRKGVSATVIRRWSSSTLVDDVSCAIPIRRRHHRRRRHCLLKVVKLAGVATLLYHLMRNPVLYKLIKLQRVLNYNILIRLSLYIFILHPHRNIVLVVIVGIFDCFHQLWQWQLRNVLISLLLLGERNIFFLL